MSSKIFYSVIALLVVGFVGYFMVSSKKETPKQPTLGAQHDELGKNHVPEDTIVNYNSNPPSSGDHYAQPAPKGFYNQELPDGNLLHNLEHGYIWVSYRPDLPTDQVQKLRSLFSQPFSDPKFQPTKAVVTKRSKNPAPISVASWGWTMNLNNFDQSKLEQFYLQHVSHSPEPAAT